VTRKALIVANPAVGGAALAALQEALRRAFGLAGIDYEFHATQPGENVGRAVAAARSRGCGLVVAAGGDGTISAVCEGLADGAVPLGIVPIGTGNLVARELGLPLEIGPAVALIAAVPATRRIDAMRVGGRICLLNVSVGISARTVSDTSRRDKRRFGWLAYVGSAVLAVIGLRPRRLLVAVDGRALKLQAAEVTVMNCGLLARLLLLNGPPIRVDDGRLDVWVLRMRTLLDLPRYLFELATGRGNRPLARFLTAERSVVIRGRQPLPAQADGDPIGTTPIEIELLPRAIPVIVPAGGR
jgi:YegS/Rv2252/BmrU family lipid kinase